MNARRSQNRGSLCLRARSALLVAVAAFALGERTTSAEVPAYDEPSTASKGETETFGADTAIGRVSYHLGRGLRLGDTRVTLGGFVNAEADALEGGESQGGLEGANLFVLFDPLSFVHGFLELESGGIAEAETGRSGVHSHLSLAVERAYGDFGASDALNLRFGKFLTPIGRWNPVPAEPLTWTASSPLIVDEVFDESTTGSMLWGSLFPRGGALSYSLYGAFLDSIRPDKAKPPVKHSAGGYLEWASLGGWSAGASYFASESPSGRWHQLGGVDGLWTPSPRMELSGEAVFGEGSRESGSLWGLYAQGVIETLDTLYAVGRYERFDPPGDAHSLDLFDVGLTWVPVPYIRLKADYEFVVHPGEPATPGFQSSLSFLF